MPPPGLKMQFWPPLTLTFDLLNLEADRFLPLPRGPLVPVCIEIGPFIFKISLFGNGRTDERTDR